MNEFMPLLVTQVLASFPQWAHIFGYIEEYLPRLIRHTPEKKGRLIGLPERYFVPTDDKMGDGFTYNEMFYWDSFFIALGLLHTQYRHMIVGMTRNLGFFLKEYGFIPNASRLTHMSHSQPPFFTQMVWISYQILLEASDPTALDFLKEMMELSEIEHDTVWLGREGADLRRVHDGHGLSRYFDIHLLPGLIQAESGWDQNSRCGYSRWLDHLPICLNAILYDRETLMSTGFQTLGDSSKADFWRTAATVRAETMQRLMWNPRRNFFADFDWVHQERNPLPSLAMFYPLWCGLATPQQAQEMVSTWLPKFEHPGGLVTSLKSRKKCQWDYPNGWAPLQMLVTDGLERYGFTTEAQRIRQAWVDMCARNLAETGHLWEKYNVVKANHEVEPGLYGQLPGFGWTIASIIDFAVKLTSKPVAAEA